MPILASLLRRTGHAARQCPGQPDAQRPRRTGRHCPGQGAVLSARLSPTVEQEPTVCTSLSLRK